MRNLINQFKNDGTLGGIVGGSLTQNGWVKFSNGLILQWGTTSKPGTITLPIAFTKFYIPISCHGHIKDWFPSQYPSTVYVVSLNQLSYGAAEGTYHYFIAIGK